jgi:hypothetical protein
MEIYRELTMGDIFNYLLFFADEAFGLYIDITVG